MIIEGLENRVSLLFYSPPLDLSVFLCIIKEIHYAFNKLSGIQANRELSPFLAEGLKQSFFI